MADAAVDRREGRRGHGAAGREPLSRPLRDLGVVALAALPPIVLAWLFVVTARDHDLAVDFTHAYLSAARDLLHGHSPYHPLTVTTGEAFVYPPIAGFLVAPFTLLGTTAASVVWSAIVGAASLGVLRVLKVHDRRCYGAALLWYPTLSGIQTGNLTLLLALVVALVWRYRDRPLAGVLAGLAVGLKLFTWPLVLFLLVTRRARSAALACGVAAGAILLPWAAIGFAGLRDYPSLLTALERWEGSRSHTVAALVAPYVGWTAGRALTYAVGAALVLLAWRLRGSDRRAFLVLLAAALELSPVVWVSYLVFLCVPLALADATLGWWLLPLMLWLPALGLNAGPFGALLVLAVPAAVFAHAVRADREAGARRVPADGPRREALAAGRP